MVAKMPLDPLDVGPPEGSGPRHVACYSALPLAGADIVLTPDAEGGLERLTTVDVEDRLLDVVVR